MCLLQRDLPFARPIRPVYRHNSQEAYTLNTVVGDIERALEALKENRLAHDEQCRRYCWCPACQLLSAIESAIKKYHRNPVVMPPDWHSGDHADEFGPAEDYCPIQCVNPYDAKRVEMHIRDALLDIEEHDREHDWAAERARKHLLAGNVVWLEGYQWKASGVA
jgi:hypothetical protein